ncbi:MAG: hypothetical protein WCL44_11580 [bacterium]
MDGCPGGVVERHCDGKEYPFHNFSSLTDGHRGIAVVSRDVFGCDVARTARVLCTATGYGTVGIRRGKPFLEVVSGAIAVERIECRKCR